MKRGKKQQLFHAIFWPVQNAREHAAIHNDQISALAPHCLKNFIIYLSVKQTLVAVIMKIPGQLKTCVCQFSPVIAFATIPPLNE